MAGPRPHSRLRANRPQGRKGGGGPDAPAAPAGDRFTYFYGDRKGEIIRPDDVPLASKQMLVYPLEPQTGTIRDGSRLNMVLLIRFPSEQLDERTRANASEGVVAYSAICTHQGCPVTNWAQRPSNAFLPLS